MHITSSSSVNVTGTVGWVGDPDGRGTSGLALSCVITLSMCVWTALHLNIPPKHETRTQYWIRNTRWIALGVFIPELVVLAAWRQWTNARSLTTAIKRLISDREQGGIPLPKSTDHPTIVPSQCEWTALHSHFAGMGGFVTEVDTTMGSNSSRPNDIFRLTLTSHGMLLLARCGVVPLLKATDIRDKSKADGLAKAVVILQAGWMLSETLGRLAAGLPISLLEVNTLAHIFCAFVIYVLWWSKPREVYEPVIVQGDWINEISAYMFMSSRMSGNQEGRLVPRSWHRPELSKLFYVSPHPARADDIGHFLRRPSHEESPEGDTHRMRSMPSLNRFASDKATDKGAIPNKKPQASMTSTSVSEPKSGVNVEEHIHRQALALRAINKFPAIRERFKAVTERPDGSIAGAVLFEPELEQLVVAAASNWPSDHQMGKLKGQTLGMALWLASMAYGGVHIAAWNEHFPTSVERFLWHLSSVYVACSGLFWFSLNVLAFYWPWAQNWFHDLLEMKIHWTQMAALGFGAGVCGLLYVFSRLYLVIEAIISLRSVPATIYATPNWSQAVPHF